jgi:hypothetical protein
MPFKMLSFLRLISINIEVLTDIVGLFYYETFVLDHLVLVPRVYGELQTLSARNKWCLRFQILSKLLVIKLDSRLREVSLNVSCGTKGHTFFLGSTRLWSWRYLRVRTFHSFTKAGVGE